MKMLLSTTAIVLAFGFPALAQDADAGSDTEMQQQTQGEMNGFMSARGQSDIFASDLMGHEVYAHRSSQDTDLPAEGQAQMNADGSQEMPMMNRSDLENMEQIGQVNEIVLSSGGEIVALVIGVGGFLGMGEQNIAVSMEQVRFSADADDSSQMFITINAGADTLGDAPAYDRTASLGNMTQGDNQGQSDEMMADDGTQGESQGQTNQMASTDDGMGQGDRTPFMAPEVEREGYTRAEARDITTEMLMGESVYDIDDNDVGTVDDMILGEDGSVTHIIIDFGGFLGIGSSQASIGFGELTILTTEGFSDVRIYVDATEEQIQDLPLYTASR